MLAEEGRQEEEVRKRKVIYEGEKKREAIERINQGERISIILK